MNLDPDKRSHQIFAWTLATMLIALANLTRFLPEKWQEWFVRQFDDVDSIWMD